MKKLVVASLAAALGGLVGAPQPVQANDRELVAAIGGFIGGVIVGSASRDAHREPVYCPPPPRGRDVVIIDRGPPRGHWEWVTVRAWVPGRWVVRIDNRGHRVRYFASGYYDVRRERVWVDHATGRRYDRDHWR